MKDPHVSEFKQEVACTMSTPTDNGEKLHIVMFPWLDFDHMIPFLELAKLIAKKGHKLTYVSTPQNIRWLPNPPLNWVLLPLPIVESVPDNAKATVDVPSGKVSCLVDAFDRLETELTRFLEASMPDWIIYDFAPPWLPTVVGNLGISRAFFNVRNASFVYSMIKGCDLPNDIIGPLGVHRLWSRCDVFATRDCTEFEPHCLNTLRKVTQKPVIPVGLMPSLVHDSEDDKTYTWLAINDWLQKQNKESVAYVALGIEVFKNQESLSEMAIGLELSSLPFLWALRRPHGSTELGSVKLSLGFEERTKARGIVCRTWVPQAKVLAHGLVGCFMTGCGWSSVIEGLQFGRSLLMMPFTEEQRLNTRVCVKKNMGIEIAQVGSLTRNSVADTLKLVMSNDNNEGKLIREKVKMMNWIFGDKARHDLYMDNFVDYLQNYRSLNKVP